MSELTKSILDAVKIIISEDMKNLNYDYTFTAVIKTNEGNGRFIVTYNDQDFSTPIRAGLVLNVGDIVYVRCPGGRFTDRFIDLKRP